MSTLRADTIQSTGGGAATLTKQSAVKAHVRFNGTGTVAISGYSLNVTSITDFGTGNYEAILTNALAANEGVHFRTSNSPSTFDGSSGAANKMPITTANSSGTNVDSARCYCSVHGDLA
jgi:hypothetical protein